MNNKFLIEKNPETIKKLVRVGAIEEECEEVRISLLEAVYWIEKGILDADKDKLLKELKKNDELTETKYTVLKYLTNNGYITRASGDNEFLRVHEKGIKRGEDRTHYVLKVVTPDWNPTINEITKLLEFAGNIRKELVIATVTNERPFFLKISPKKF